VLVKYLIISKLGYLSKNSKKPQKLSKTSGARQNLSQKTELFLDRKSKMLFKFAFLFLVASVVLKEVYGLELDLHAGEKCEGKPIRTIICNGICSPIGGEAKSYSVIFKRVFLKCTVSTKTVGSGSGKRE
jgi:hypothetical protein